MRDTLARLSQRPDSTRLYTGAALAALFSLVSLACDEPNATTQPPEARSTQQASSFDWTDWLEPHKWESATAIASSTRLVMLARGGDVSLYTRTWDRPPADRPSPSEFASGSAELAIESLADTVGGDWRPSLMFGHDLAVASVYGSSVINGSLALDRDTTRGRIQAQRLYVSDPYATDWRGHHVGAVFIFVAYENGRGAVQVVHTSTVTTEERGSYFGWDIDVESEEFTVGGELVAAEYDNLIVGAPGTRDGIGEVYLYAVHRRSGQGWFQDNFRAPTGTGRFGRSVAVLSNGDDVTTVAASATRRQRGVDDGIVLARVLGQDAEWAEFQSAIPCEPTPLSTDPIQNFDKCYGRSLDLVRNPTAPETRAVLLITDPKKDGLHHVWSDKESGFADADARPAGLNEEMTGPGAGCQSWGAQVEAINSFSAEANPASRSALILGIVSGFNCTSGQRVAVFKGMNAEAQSIDLDLLGFHDERGDDTSASGPVGVDFTGFWLVPDYGPYLGFVSHFVVRPPEEWADRSTP